MRRKNNKVLPNTDSSNRSEDDWVITRSGIRIRIQHKKPPVEFHGRRNTLFFIHGVAGSSDVWTSQLSHFSSLGYRVIAPDLIGHGFSSAPNITKLYAFASICSNILDVFDHYATDSNTVIGHSYGTSFAAYLARYRTSRVDRVVLMSGGAPVALAPQPGLLSIPSVLLICIKPILPRMFYRNAFHKKNKYLPNKHAAFDVPLYVLQYTMKGQVWYEGEEEFHKKITQPVLLLHGESDKLESAENTAEMYQVLQNSEFHIISEAGHMIMMEQPSIINRLIQRFIQSDDVSADGQMFTPVASAISPRKQQKTGEHSQHMTKSQPHLKHS